jgi:hypothetical protein
VKGFTPVLNVVVQEEYSRLTGMAGQCAAKRFIILKVANIFPSQSGSWLETQGSPHFLLLDASQ